MRVSRALGRDLPVTVVSTFLGAHGLAPEFAGRRDDYVDFMCNDVIPEAVKQGLVDQVDGFCDKVGFTHEQMGRLYGKAKSYGLPVKAHADQYTDFGVGALVARHGGLSADHLEFASLASVRAMAEAGTVATLLAGAHLTLHETRKPPVEMFREFGVPIALATNSNPVSSPTVSPASQMHLACYLFRLTPEEALRGFTVNGARALGPVRYGRPHRRRPRGRPRRLGYVRSARHLLPDRRRALPRRREERRRRPRSARADVRRARHEPARKAAALARHGERPAARVPAGLHAHRHLQSAGRHDRGGRSLPALPRRGGPPASHRGAAGSDAQPDQQLQRRVAGPSSGAERPSRRVPDRRSFGVEARSAVGRYRRRPGLRPRHGRHEVRDDGAAVRPCLPPSPARRSCRAR